MTTPSPSPYIDVVVHLDEKTILPPLRVGYADAGMIPYLVQAQVLTATHVRTVTVQALMEIEEDVDGQ